MNAEFNWWLLIVGIGVGAGLAWLILADLTRRADDIAEHEVAEEIAWIGEALATSGRPTSPETIDRVLRLHGAYQMRGRHDDASAADEPMAHPAGEVEEREAHPAGEG